MEAEMNEKYGKNPRGAEAQAKIEAKKQWHDTHSIKNKYGKYEANPHAYINKTYTALSEDQKKILDRILEFKRDLDDLLPENKVYTHKAIQMRRNGSMRFMRVLQNPTTIFKEIKEHLADEFLDREDDNLIYGEYRKGLKDFNGREYLELPALYTNRLNDPNELSTDIIGTLMAYSAMARQYHALDEVVDALSIGQDIMFKDHGVTNIGETRGSNEVVEVIKDGVTTIVQKIGLREGSSNLEAKLQDFMEAQVFGRHLKDQGSKEIAGKSVNLNKVASFALKTSSVAQLGFNFLANLAGVMQGIYMQNIEAAVQEHFSAKDLALADAAYAALLPAYLAQIGSKNPQSKLHLFDQAIDFKGDFFKDMKHADQRNLIKRVLGRRWAFIGQETGDHWLYNRTAIAMAMRKKVNVPGKGEMSLWDAITVEDAFADRSDIKELRLPEGTTYVENGEKVSMLRFGREVLELNQKLFGIYNEEDSNAANRVILGRLLLQYRKFMRPLWQARFGSARRSMVTGKESEGYYVTVYNAVKDIMIGKQKAKEVWDSLTDHQKKNVGRVAVDLAQFFALFMVAKVWLGDEKNKRLNYAEKLANYAAQRLYREQSMFIPSHLMVSEWLTTVQAPAATLSLVEDACDVVTALLTPSAYYKEIQSGPYEGMTGLEKAFYKAPLPLLTYYRQMDKAFNRVDEQADFYMKSRR
jgi:hypothetical protein